ncbi:troponin T, slow skeletal muscle-like [Oncorhynchus mykiss]|uniref:troponin T, slow skeletal muscle-like n=1 Tax=Oncorhynchus mykiss TaxID=8022 RepID=UPI000B4E9A88|nr:troponin T, slow skeletal muscle-like [Oncorhynchus mykiss]
MSKAHPPGYQLCCYVYQLLPPPTFSWSPRQRAQEMWNWIYTLESDKFDFIDHMKKQKYQIIVLLNRITSAQKFKKGPW